MRRDIIKVLFVGTKDDKQSFFQTAQECGFIHFIGKAKDSSHLPEDLERLSQALKLIRKMQPSLQDSLNDDFSRCDALVGEILEDHQAYEKSLEKKRILQAEMARVRP